MANAKELFEDKLPKIIQENLELVKKIESTYLFRVIGENGGAWFLDFNTDDPSVNPGEPEDIVPDCSVVILAEDLDEFLAKPAAGMMLFIQGKIKIDGDPKLIGKLQFVFGAPQQP